VLTALWDLVWAGEVTNDTLAPLRALGARRPRTGRSRPRPGRLSRVGPPAAAGRWSLVAPLLDPVPAPTEIAVARARQLLERHGVLTREAARAEGVPGGFAAVYPTLRAMEESGHVRRGYFVAGLGAAQFALPGAVDRLRAGRPRDDHEMLVLAATDPAQPYGAALPWPETEGGKPARAAGAHVVIRDGALVAFLERGGRNLITFPGATTDPTAWLEALAGLVKHGRRSKIELHRVDGAAVRDAPLADALRTAGFQDSYRGLVLRP
jgi:ATP-dependent helicase Lhr and Lhr-like helicase